MGISKTITKKLINYNSEDSFAFKMRKKRAERIRMLINKCYEEKGKVDIIDIGGTKVYWKIIPFEFLKEKNVKITLINLPDSVVESENDDIFTYKSGDGCHLEEYMDEQFDIAHSNSVIEHVGSWENKSIFSNETRRVAKKYYLQTPNYWFPVEPHFMTPFFHWLPKRIRLWLLMNFNLGWYEKAKSYSEAKENDDGCSLLTEKELKTLLPDGNLFKEKFLVLNKSLIVIRD